MTDTVDPAYTLEVRIIKQLIADALAAGYLLGVNDGEETVIDRSTDGEAILEAMFSTDEDFLLTYSGDQPSFARRHGWVHLVHGNGWCVISDYSTNLEHIMAGANKIADEGEAADAEGLNTAITKALAAADREDDAD